VKLHEIELKARWVIKFPLKIVALHFLVMTEQMLVLLETRAYKD